MGDGADFRGHDGQQGDKVQGQQTQADEESTLKGCYNGKACEMRTIVW